MKSKFFRSSGLCFPTREQRKQGQKNEIFGDLDFPLSSFGCFSPAETWEVKKYTKERAKTQLLSLSVRMFVCSLPHLYSKHAAIIIAHAKIITITIITTARARVKFTRDSLVFRTSIDAACSSVSCVCVFFFLTSSSFSPFFFEFFGLLLPVGGKKKKSQQKQRASSS